MLPKRLPLLSGIGADCEIADKGYESNRLLSSPVKKVHGGHTAPVEPKATLGIRPGILSPAQPDPTGIQQTEALVQIATRNDGRSIYSLSPLSDLLSHLGLPTADSSSGAVGGWLARRSSWPLFSR